MMQPLAGGLTPLGVGRRAATASNGLLNNLIDFWPLNEAGGANNAVGLHAGLTLTQNSSPGADTGKVYATARTFDGAADHFSRASEAALQTGDVDFTIAAWVYSTASGIRLVISKDSTTPNRDYAIYQYDTNLYFTVWNSAGTAKEATVSGFSLNTWQLITAWHDSAGDTISISLNNGAPGSLATGGALRSPTSAQFWIGAYGSPGERWVGRIGPAAMWKSAAGGGGVLSEAQRAAQWNGGAGLAYADFTT